ncbi:MAG: hypothetical protein QOF75_1903 [Gaiellaceae bacterium]|jgi:uncharacterized protein YndB with AHSA1/START domain|nr:hypothetical protein [Gaiellaceae bacterium]MDX6472945.1 hypothetical protein [Gaiellaceae bacterium]
MRADRIEREIQIDAPIDVVWAVVTEPEHIATWFSDEAEIDLRPGGDGRLVWQLKATNRAMAVNLRVERHEPPHAFSFRWNHPDGVEPTESNAALVEFSLEADGESTRLRLVESGLETLESTDAEKESYFAEHSNGWDKHLGTLLQYAVDQRNAAATR